MERANRIFIFLVSPASAHRRAFVCVHALELMAGGFFIAGEGDTPAGVARAMHVSLEELLELNQNKFPGRWVRWPHLIPRRSVL